MKSPGVTVRPLKQATGDSHFNEVFFDDVFVPDEDIVGELGEGWKVAMATLGNERHSIGSMSGDRDEERLVEIITQERYVGTRQGAVAALGRVTAAANAVAALNLSEDLRALDGQAPGPGSSIAKLAAAQTKQLAATTAHGLLGPAGAVDDDPFGAAHAVLETPTWTVGGGTAEIQLNAVSRFVLGLPRSY